jgi:5'-nucleotidase
MSLADLDRTGAPIALIDLGDTLCECTPALGAALRRLRQPGERREDEALVPLPIYLETRRRQVMSAPNFWRDLPPRRPGMELLALLRDLGFRIHVLTKGPGDAAHVWAEKVAWCHEHVPGVPVTVTDDKARVHGHVLVDDWLPYVEDWQRQWPDGLAIVPAHSWNAGAVEGPRLIRDEGGSREKVHALLRRALAR